MHNAAAWSVRGVGRETREIAEEAARRAGMSLGDWLDEVVAEQAAERGVSVDDWDEDEKLDAIVERLSRLSLHERAAVASRREVGEEGAAPRPERRRSGEEPRRARDRSEAAADDSLSESPAIRRDYVEKRVPGPDRRRSGEDLRRARSQSEAAADYRDVADERDAVRERASRPPRAAATVRDESKRAPHSESRLTPDPQQIATAEAEDADKLEAIADRLSRLSRERARAAIRPSLRVEAPNPRPESNQSPEEALRAQQFLEGAVAKFESRAAKTEDRTAKAFESVASWIEQSQAERAQERATLQSVAEKLTAIERHAVREVERPPVDRHRAASQGEDAGADIDKRLSALVRRAATPNRPRSELRRDERPRIDVGDSVAQIVRRQTELDLRERGTTQSATPRKAVRDFAVDSAGAGMRASESRIRPIDKSFPTESANAASVEESLRREIAALSARIERLRMDEAEQPAPPIVAEDLRAGLAAMSSSLAALAPRNASVALEGAVGDFGQRLNAARQAGASDHLVTPVESMLDEVRETLRHHDPRIAAEGLEREIRALNGKVEALARATVSPEVFERLRGQTEEVRNLLADAAMRPVPVERLERQIGYLADRVEHLATSPTPQADTARVLESLSEARSQIERSTPAAALKSIERRLEQLATRMDEALNRTPTMDSRPLEDLAHRIEGVRFSVERQAEQQLNSAKLEAVLHDINSKLDRPPAAGVDSKVLTSTLRDLTARLDEAFHRPPAAANFDPRPIEDLARRIEAVRATVERQTDFRPHAAKLEAALTDIKSKLDRPPAAGVDSKALTSTLQDLTARLEEAFRRPQVSAKLDPQPIEDLARRIEAVRATVERQTDFRPHAAKLEAALTDINSKLDRPPAAASDSKALATTLQVLTGRLEEIFRKSASSSNFDPKPIEDLTRRIEAVRAMMERQGDFRPHAEKLEAALSDINSKLERTPDASNSNALTSTLQDLSARLDEAFRRPAAAPKFDPEPLEDLARRIDDVRATIEKTTEFLPDAEKLDAALANIGAKLDRQAFSPADLQALTGALQNLASRIDQAGPSIVDTAPIERILRNFGQRTIEVDTTPIETMLRDLGEKFAASTGPVAIDTGPIEHMLGRVDAKLDAVSRLPMDVRPLEHAVRELHEKLDFRDAPRIDAEVIEQAADLLAQRLERRDGPRVDADALVSQISEIHGRLDSLHSPTESNVALERTVAELLDELETTRRTLQSAASAVSAANSASPVIDDIAELRAEQTNSDRRMQARLADVHEILEQLVGRLGRIDEEASRADEVGRADEDQPVPQRSAPTFGVRTTISDSRAGAQASDAALRSIPDRVPLPSAREGSAGAPRGAYPNSSGETNFLLEPGCPPSRAPDLETDSPVRNSGINAHIAAARRAAQAALLDSASKAEEASASRSPGPLAGSWGSPLKQAQEFFAARRRPILLGVAFLAIVTTLAVVALRGGSHPQAVQKSELPAPIQSPAPLASIPKDSGALSAASVDHAPVGSVAPARTLTPSALRRAPADMVTLIPASVATTLRDSASAGDTGAETELALRYLDGRTLPRDPKMAARWFEQAAVQGLPIAQYRLAALYEKGTGVTRDVALARSWYLKAANAGNARAMHNLAVLAAEDGGTGRPDYADAAQWFRRAGELGVRDSQFNLGVLYGRGLGVPQDLQQSWLWFSLASQQGDADAGKKRDEVAVKLDSKALAAANKLLAEFKQKTPDPSANEAPTPAGGWDVKADAPQSGRQPTPAAGRTVSLPGARI